MTFRINKVRIGGGVRAMWGGSWVWGMVPAMSGWQSPTPHYPSPLPQYTLVRDVVSSLRRHRMHEQQFTHPPLLVLNSFGPHGMHVKLMATMFQNLFPSINVHKVGWASRYHIGPGVDGSVLTSQH